MFIGTRWIQASKVWLGIRLSITLYLATVCCACPSYYTSDNRKIPLGCVSGIDGSVPWEPTEINTRFFVYDWNNMENPQRSILWNASLDPNDPIFNPGDQLDFIIHGLTASYKQQMLQEMKDVILQRNTRAKVLFVDWSEGAFDGASVNATYKRTKGANNALVVGRVLACFTERLISTYGIPETSVNFFGHSMGSQVLGQATAWLSKSFGIRIGNGIVSEASSRPFEREGIHPNKEDVRFLLAAHTTYATGSEANSDGALGIPEAFADVDLYPNRGRLHQPGCKGQTILCSHRRAFVYLTQIVAECNEQCDLKAHVCRNEEEAFDGKCSERTVNVCGFIKDLKSRATGPERKSNILTFETDMEKLHIECESTRAELSSE